MKTTQRVVHRSPAVTFQTRANVRKRSNRRNLIKRTNKRPRRRKRKKKRKLKNEKVKLRSSLKIRTFSEGKQHLVMTCFSYKSLLITMLVVQIIVTLSSETIVINRLRTQLKRRLRSSPFKMLQLRSKKAKQASSQVPRNTRQKKLKFM